MTDNNNMKSNDWTDQLRKQLADHQEPAPEGLWDRIEAQLDAETPQQPVIVPITQRHTSLRRWMVAASVALLIGGGAYVFLHQPQTPMTVAPTKKETTIAQTTTKQSATTTGAHPSLFAKQPSSAQQSFKVPQPSHLLAQASIKEEVAQKAEILPAIDQSPSTEQILPEPISVEPSTPEQSTIEPSQEKALAATLSEKRTTSVPIQKEMIEDTPLPGWERDGSGASFSLYAQNNLIAEQQKTPVLMSEAFYGQFNSIDEIAKNGYRRGAPMDKVYLSNYDEKKHHHLPLAIGLSVSYPLNNSLALSSGLVYTRAASDFQQTMSGSTINTQQTLHYIGIPLQLHYTLLQWQTLSLYANAGGQADVNVKARRTTEGVPVKVSHDRLQWSLTGAIGVQYPIIPHLALYGEAGARWYIDNNSSLETYFKEHPLSPNLQVGLRFTLGQE